MNYFFQGLSVFLGLIAGVLVSILTEVYIRRQQEKQKVKHLKLELQVNIHKINTWLELLNQYRNAINSETVSAYYGYFDFSRALSFAVFDFLQSGMLYKYLGSEEISNLQVIFSDFSVYGENYITNQINLERQEFNKARATQNLNFWGKKLKDNKKVLEDILAKLK